MVTKKQQSEAFLKAKAWHEAQQQAAALKRKEETFAAVPPPPPPTRGTRRSSTGKKTVQVPSNPPPPPPSRRGSSRASAKQVSNTVVSKERAVRRTRGATKQQKDENSTRSTRRQTIGHVEPQKSTTATVSRRKSLATPTRTTPSSVKKAKRVDDNDDGMEVDYDSDVATATPSRATTSKRTLRSLSNNGSKKKPKNAPVLDAPSKITSKQEPTTRKRATRSSKYIVRVEEPPSLVSEPIRAAPKAIAVAPPPPPPPPLQSTKKVPPPVDETTLLPSPPAATSNHAVAATMPSRNLPKLHCTPRKPRPTPSNVLTTIPENEAKIVVTPDHQSTTHSIICRSWPSRLLAILVVVIAVGYGNQKAWSMSVVQSKVSEAQRYVLDMGVQDHVSAWKLYVTSTLPSVVQSKLSEVQQHALDFGVQEFVSETWTVVQTSFDDAKRYLATSRQPLPKEAPKPVVATSAATTQTLSKEHESKFLVDLLTKWSYLHTCSLNGNPFHVDYDTNGSLFPLQTIMDSLGLKGDGYDLLDSVQETVRLIDGGAHGWLVGLRDAPTECNRSMEL